MNDLDKLKKWIQEEISEQKNWTYGRILSYNNETKRAEVLPLVKIDGVENKPIANVPVMSYSCGAFSFEIPYKQGDVVRLFFTNIGLSDFQGSEINEDETEINALNNCVALPCEFNQNAENFIKISESGSCEVRMLKSIVLTANEINVLENISKQNEIIIQAINALCGAVVNVPSLNTPTPLTISSVLVQAKTNLETLNNQLKTVISI